MTYSPLPIAFFARPTLEVARDLLGHLLVYHHPAGDTLAGQIVEAEAYTQNDPAFHPWKSVDRETGLIKPEGRTAAFFDEPGRAYIYNVYYSNWLLNVVTEPEGYAGAVLIRAIEPLEGLDRMRMHRVAARRDRDLTNGPGKLTQAFGLDGSHHGLPLTAPPLYLAAPPEPLTVPIATSSRIGLTRGIDRPWRFFIQGNAYVSPGTPSDQRKR